MEHLLTHRFLTAPFRLDRETFYPKETGKRRFVVDCHRNLRGPYTGTGSLIRALAPEVYQKWPELLENHLIEILTVAPELRDQLPAKPETLTSLAIPEERTRFYSRLRTLRLTHGLIHFLRKAADEEHLGALQIVFENVQDAEVLDREFIQTLLRRASPARLQIFVSFSSDLSDVNLQKALQTYAKPIAVTPLSLQESSQLLQERKVTDRWREWLLEHAAGWRGEWEAWSTGTLSEVEIEPGMTLEQGIALRLKELLAAKRTELAVLYVQSDGTTDQFFAALAYEHTDLALRQVLHDERATALRNQNEWSLHLGAIPYHLERGSKPQEVGIPALIEALDYCINTGFYEATVDFGQRGRALFAWEDRPDAYWTFTTKMTTSLAALGRPEEAEPLYNEARALFPNPMIHMQAAYATAMLYTRHHTERNHQIAKGWSHASIAFASLIEDPKQRAFNSVFNRNGLALVELHLGNPQKALNLVTEGLEELEQLLNPDEHLLHRSVLLYNRAQILAGMKRFEEAIADYTKVIQIDPHYSEYHFDRGNLFNRLGQLHEALHDYNQAIQFSPPYPEVYYNRAGVYFRLGATDLALNDYDLLLELEPDHVDGLLNRASLLNELEQWVEARTDAERGLSLQPNHPQLLCTLGLIELAEGRYEKAEHAFTAALDLDPPLVAAWSNRAVLRYETQNIDGAIADLTQALHLERNATVLYNRAFAYQAALRWEESIADLTDALELEDADVQEIYYQRGRSFYQIGDLERAHDDFEKHLSYGESAYLEEIRLLVPSL